MNILIAGGSGLIGHDLSRALLDNGHQVRVLTRSPQTAKLAKGAQAVGWDGKTPEGWLSQLEQSDALINLAGENIGDLPWTNERKAKIRSSRVEVGRAITRAIEAAAHRPRVLLQASGVSYYGSQADQVITEQSPAGHDFTASVAVDWEASTQGVEALGVRRVIMRTGIYLSPEGGALTRFLYAWRLYLGGPMGSGSQWISWIHPYDYIHAIQFLIENEQASGPFNLTAPEPLTNREFGRTLAEVMEKPFWAPIPAFAIKLLFGEMSTMVLDGQRVVPERLLEMGYPFKFEHLRPALEDLLGERFSSKRVYQSETMPGS